MKKQDNFFRYTYKKHGGSLLMLIAILVAGIFIALHDTLHDYQGGAWVFVSFIAIVPTSLFVLDYLKNR